MTAITPRVTLGRLARSNAVTRVSDRIATRPRLPRPPAFIVVCATVGVLNIVGLVMILSASSVASLSSYGTAWFFFERQLMWATLGFVAFLIAARIDYRRWRQASPFVLAA